MKSGISLSPCAFPRAQTLCAARREDLNCAPLDEGLAGLAMQSGGRISKRCWFLNSREGSAEGDTG